MAEFWLTLFTVWIRRKETSKSASRYVNSSNRGRSRTTYLL